jgi:hypothetical protein
MEMRLIDRNHKPGKEDIYKAIGNDAKKGWDGIQKFMAKYYEIEPETVFYGSNYGWNIRYRKSGKTLCSLFPEKGSFTFLIVLGKKEVERAIEMLNEFDKTIQDIILNTEQLHDGRWLWIRVYKNEKMEDMKKLIQIKRKTRKPELHNDK